MGDPDTAFEQVAVLVAHRLLPGAEIVQINSPLAGGLAGRSRDSSPPPVPRIEPPHQPASPRHLLSVV